MKTVELRKKLHSYIDIAHEKKLIAIYTMVEDEIGESYNKWNDKDFVKEMNRRMSELETGKIKSHTWDEVKKRSMKKVKSVKARK